MTFLRINALSKRFGDVVALGGATIEAKQGSRTAIVGPSGSGKTTLLRLIAGFDTPDSGSIELGNETLVDASQSMPAHKRRIGVIAQDGALFPHLTVGDNIGFGLERHAPHREEQIGQLAETVGLNRAMLTRRPDELSGGQQQRVAIARALARQPRLMLLDEPFSALDTGLRGAMRKAVGDILDRAGVTTILITHDQSEALSFADQVAVMNNGTIEQIGAPREVYFHPANRMVADFLGEAIIVPAEIGNGMVTCIFGRLPTIDGHADNADHVMVRPEQVIMSRQSSENALQGTVSATEFAGSQCLVTIDIADPAGAEAHQIVLHASAYDLPDIGDSVYLTIRGPVHLIG